MPNQTGFKPIKKLTNEKDDLVQRRILAGELYKITRKIKSLSVQFAGVIKPKPLTEIIDSLEDYNSSISANTTVVMGKKIYKGDRQTVRRIK